MSSPAGISIKRLGLIAAALLALVFITIIVVSMRVGSGTPPQSNDPFFADPEDIADIEQTQSGGSMFVTIVDQNDPTRVSSTLRADRFEPIGEGRRRLDQPESWIYMKDGRALRVNADYATMLMPDPNQAPESGTLEGSIVIRAYDSTPAPGTPPPDTQQPALTARFEDTLEFERRYLRMRTPGRFEIESRSVDFSGSDLTVILNDLRGRIELIDVMQGDRLVIHTDAIRNRDGDNDAQSTPAQPGPSTEIAANERPESSPPAKPATETISTNPARPLASDDAQTTQNAPEPDIERYRVSFESEIVAQIAGSGRVNADTMTLWAAIIDGQLPQDAIRRIALATNATHAAPASELTKPASDTSTKSAPSSTPRAPSKTNPQPATPTSATDSGGVIITWSGPMRVRPIDDQIPDQLIQDHLALRLESNEGSGISMIAPERGFNGQAKQLTYYATRAIVDLAGEQTDQGIVRLGVEDSGTLYAESLNADLASGLIKLKRRGSITTTTDDPTQTASVQWKNNAQIKFAIDEQGALTQRLEHASFEGAAIAEQNGNSIGARIIEASLDPTLPPVSALRTLQLTEGVISSADKQMLTGRDLTIDFEPSTDGVSPPRPVRVSSIGSSMGRNADAMLRANEMHATLVRVSDGSTRIETAIAEGNVSYRDSKRTTATANTLQADGLNEIITLTGPGTKVTQAGSSIAGEHITLRAKRRSIEVVGPGTFDHDVALNESEHAMPGQMGQVNARWDSSMRFEDTLGTIECIGAVRVISTPDALTRDTLKADRITINLTPMPTTDRIENAPTPERQLISARAAGRAEQGKQPEPASIESRSYSPNNPELAIGVLYLEGAQILADNQKQTLTVPGSGTLLVLDRETKENPQPSDTALDGSGLTRFTWESRMQLDRNAGQGVFTGGVKVDHKSLTSNKIATLETDSLTADFAISDPSQMPDQARASSNALRQARAEGHVRFRFDGRELLSDIAHYDAIADSLFASTVDNNLVTLYDSKSTTPFSARTMLWNLKTDQLQFDAPSPVRVTPGG